MFVSIRIALTSPFLGSSKLDKNGVRKIILNANKKPKFFIKRFSQLCEKYAKELNIGNYTSDAIRTSNFLTVFENPILFSKRFYSKEGKSVKETFETYPEGSQMEFGCFIDESKITIDQAIKIIEYIGKYNGISQFGFNWNYGRFDILTVTKDKYETPVQLSIKD